MGEPRLTIQTDKTQLKDSSGTEIGTSTNPLIVREGGSLTSFGEIQVAPLTPLIQLTFPYNINPEIISDRSNNGSLTIDSSRLKLSTGASANQSAEMQSIRPIRYVPGQGALIRFTRIYTTGTTNSTQLQGVGSSGDGLFFGYNGTSFGILRREKGVSEVRTLTITTGSSTAENITITLDGDADSTVSVTNTGDTTLTANEIADHDFSGLGRGWSATAVGSTVIFESYDSSSRTGTYSLSGATTAVGTFAQTIAGVAQTDNWTAQSSWNVDVMDGTGDSGVTLDQTKGNVYQINYQWLGYGQITFGIEDENTGNIIDVHKIKYANQNTDVLFQNPTLPLYASVENTSNTSDITGFTPSFAGFIEGSEGLAYLHHGQSASASGVGTTETPILTIRNKLIYQNSINRNRIRIAYIAASVDGTKPAIIRMVKNGVLTGASFSDVDTNATTVSFDTSSTAISNGIRQIDIGLAKTSGEVINMSQASFELAPNEWLTITAEASSGTTDVVASFNWEDLL